MPSSRNILRTFSVSTLLCSGILLLTPSPAAATSKSYMMTAEVPSSQSASMAIYNVDLATGTRTVVTGSDLNFDPLTYDPSNSIYKASRIFSLEFDWFNYADVTLTYTEGANPNDAAGSSRHGLGWKVAAVVHRAGHQSYMGQAAYLGSFLLKDLQGTQFWTGGLHSLSVGLQLVPTDWYESPSGSEAFSPADRPGSYTGTLVVSITSP